MSIARISHAAMALLGWVRVDSKPWRLKTSAVWKSTNGWTLMHCGHPTAIHPWALYDRFGSMWLAGIAGPRRRKDFGSAWNTLREAATWHHENTNAAGRYVAP